jgi:hypothetical protein
MFLPLWLQVKLERVPPPLELPPTTVVYLNKPLPPLPVLTPLQATPTQRYLFAAPQPTMPDCVHAPPPRHRLHWPPSELGRYPAFTPALSYPPLSPTEDAPARTRHHPPRPAHPGAGASSAGRGALAPIQEERA